MKSTLKATPTEYKGVRYRSKSEAIFARHLELTHAAITQRALVSALSRKLALNCGGVAFATGFVYEHEPHRLNGVVPDFSIWSISLPCDAIKWEIIEYKPAMPTMEYIIGFFDRAAKLAIPSSIYFGSVFDDPSDLGILVSADEVRSFDWMAFTRQRVKDTRFDLEQSR